jgi:ribonuclease P protein component
MFAGFITTNFSGVAGHDADLSSAQPQADQQAWFPRPDGDAVGAGDPVAPPQEGAQAPHGFDRFQARGPLTAERFPEGARIALASELRAVQAEGRRRRTAHLEMVWRDNTAGRPRLGLIVPRFQFTAVARNRLRRRLKELWRRELQGGLPGLDLVIRAKREGYGATFAELRTELLAWRTAL